MGVDSTGVFDNELDSVSPRSVTVVVRQIRNDIQKIDLRNIGNLFCISHRYMSFQRSTDAVLPANIRRLSVVSVYAEVWNGICQR